MVTLHDVEPRSPEWFAIREPRIGSSEAHAVVAKSRNGGTGEAVTHRDLRVQVALSRLGGHPRQSTFVNAAMTYGIETEDRARSIYEMTTGRLVNTPGYITNDALPGLGYSPDGCVGEVGLLEIKCPKDATHWHTIQADTKAALAAAASGETSYWPPLRAVPSTYHYQILHALLVSSDRDWIDFCSYSAAFPELLQLYVARVERSQVTQELEQYRTAVSLFEAEVQDTMNNITDWTMAKRTTDVCMKYGLNQEAP
jgi:hypothetical protein